jgi:hypothetical protein
MGPGSVFEVQGSSSRTLRTFTSGRSRSAMVVTSPSSLARSSSESNAPPVTAQSLAGRCHRSASRCCLQDERRTMSGGAAALLLYFAAALAAREALT